MDVPIFSPKGYIAYAGKLFGTYFPLHGSTKDHCEAVMTDMAHDTVQNGKEGNCTSVLYGNDAILMDSGLLKQIQSSTSGFVTVKLANESMDKKSISQGRRSGRTVSPTISNRNSTVGLEGGNSFSGLMTSAIEPVVVPPSYSNSYSSALVPMTPIITCRLTRKNLSRSLSQIPSTSDVSLTQLVQCFNEAVVVPLQTMRFLGAEEGSLIRFEFHDEKMVNPASNVVFGLTSHGVGDEDSFDTYLRHFIAPFFLQQTRAISLDEEFEFKNHDRGDLHIKVISINGGYSRCALVNDNTRIHLVIQPEAPPNLQGQRNSSVPRSISRERRSTSTHNNNNNNNNNNRNINRNTSKNHNNYNNNNNNYILVPSQDSIHTRNTTSQRDGEVSPRPTIPAYLQQTRQRKSTMETEPHSAAALTAHYSPQTVDNIQLIIMEKPKPPMPTQYIRKEGIEEHERVVDNRMTNANNTPLVVSDTSPAVAVADICESPVVLRREEMNQTNTIPVESAEDHNRRCTPEQVEKKEDLNVPDKEEKMSCRNEKDSLVEVLRTSMQMGDIPMQQDDEELSHDLITNSNTTSVPSNDKHEENVEAELQDSVGDEVKTAAESLSSNAHSHKSSKHDLPLHVNEQMIVSEEEHYPEYLPEKLDISLLQEEEKEEEKEEDESLKEKLYYVDTPKSSLHPYYPEETVGVIQQVEEEEEKHNKVSIHASTTEVPEELHNRDVLEKTPIVQCDAWTQCEVPDEEISHIEDQNYTTPTTENGTNSIISHVKDDQCERVQEVRDCLWEHESVNPLDNIYSNSTSEMPKEQKEGIKTKEPVRDISEKVKKVVQEWQSVKKEWQSMPINPLLKREPYVVIKMFQYFVAIYKELKQRHTDCIAYLNSPYGHSLRGGMVVRISLLVVPDNEGDQDPVWGIKKTHYYSDTNNSIENNDNMSTYESNSEASSVAKAGELLKVSLNEISTALGCEVLHVFRVGGTCPTLYCTLIKPYKDGPDEIVLLGESCPVEVLHTTIMEDLCRVRDESRSEWMELSMQWTEAISSVLRLGVFAKHLQTVRELFWELALLLRHPGEVRRSNKYQRSVSRQYRTQSLNSGNSEKHGNGNHEMEKITAVSEQSRSESVSVNKVNNFPENEDVFYCLQELQDTYYLYSELLEPFALQSLHQLDIVAAATDVAQCEELMRFLQVSYQAQISEEEAQGGDGVLLSSLSLISGVEEDERSAFTALIEATKAGAIMPLPCEWWENVNISNKKSHTVY